MTADLLRQELEQRPRALGPGGEKIWPFKKPAVPPDYAG
jgi:hypothetical protein